MLARRIDPPHRPPSERTARQRAAGRWRDSRRTPSRGPQGEVHWWERPAPSGDLLLWEAVQRLQARRLARRVPVQALADDLARIGHRVRRETLSRVLNGKQRTSWETAEAIAEVLGVDLHDLRAGRSGDEGDDDGTVVPSTGSMRARYPSSEEGAMASFIALYTRPDDVEGFEAHYRERHLPLIDDWPNVAEIRTTRMTGTPRGTDPAFHLMAEIRFTSAEGLTEALQSDPMRASGKDAVEMCRRFGCEATMLFGEDFE